MQSSALLGGSEPIAHGEGVAARRAVRVAALAWARRSCWPSQSFSGLWVATRAYLRHRNAAHHDSPIRMLEKRRKVA
jgi:hypothetical protein